MSIFVKNLLFFIVLILFISCGKKEDTKSSELEKSKIRESRTSFELADSLSFKALYDSSNQILIPKLNHLLLDSNYSLYVDAANRISANYRKLGNYDSAFSFITKSLKISKSNLDSVNLSIAQSYYLLGLMYRDFSKTKEAFKYLNKSLRIRKSILSPDNPLIGDVYNNLGAVYSNERNYKKALHLYKMALKLRKGRGFYDKSVGSTYMNIGNALADIAQYESAVSYYDTAMTIQKKILGKNHPFIAMILLNRANSYDSIGNLDSAIASDNKALDIFKKTFGEYHPYIAHLYNNLGVYYKSFGDYENAINYYKKSIDVKDKLKANFNNEYFDNYINLGQSYRMLSNYESSITAIKKALKIIESNEKINIYRHSQTKSALALTYLNAGKKSLALKTQLQANAELENNSLNDSLSIFEIKIFLSHIYNKIGNFDKSISNTIKCNNYFKEKDVSWTIFCNELLAEAYLQKKEYLKVIDVYNDIKSFFTFRNDSNKFDFNKINSYSDVNSMFVEILSFVGKANLELFNKTQNPMYLNEAENIYKVIMELFSNNYGNKAIETSKIKGTEKVKIIIETGLKAAYKNFVLEPTKAHFEYALNLAEFGKSLTVLESLGEKSALKLSKIPHDEIEKIEELHKTIRYFVKQLSLNNPNDVSEKGKKNFQDRLFTARIKYDELKKLLENRYPIYKAFTKINLSSSLANIKNSLLGYNQSAIEYYLGDKELYTFIISKNDFYILKKNLPDNFDVKANEFLASIKNNNYNNFVSSANNIYKEIFAEADSLIKTKRILIINDGILGYIPYDVLLYKKPQKNVSYKNLPYLINKYSIGYAYSFNVLGKSKEGNNIVSKFLGIAPFSK